MTEEADTLGSLASFLATVAETPSSAIGLQPGTVLGGRFRIEARIAIGGMGVVYRAHDTQLARDVAIKLHARAQGHDGQARLLREAMAMARLSHPNVVTAYEVGTYHDDVFLAMELVDGQTIERWLRAQPRGWREVLAVHLGAGAGLCAMHRAGLVHRDVKPANILVGSDGRARIADLGLALGSEEALAGTPAGGTPRYMAPEQAAGKAFDARADQYAFAVSLREALSGRAGVPGHVRRALARALAADPGARHADMDALLAELARDPAARRRGLAAAAAGLAFLAALGVAWWPRRPSCAIGDAERAGLWTPARADALRRAFARSPLPYAPAAFAHVDAALRAYGASWERGRVEACAATRTRGAQSEALLDRRVACLESARRALVDLGTVLTEHAWRDPVVVERAAAAVDALPELARCADPQYLLALVKPPEAAIAPSVLRLRRGVEEALARYRVGQNAAGLRQVALLVPEAAALGYLPLRAEVNDALGLLQSAAAQHEAAAASLERAFFDARRAGEDGVAIEAATELARVLGTELMRFREADQWAEHAQAEVARSAPGTRAEALLLAQLGNLRGRQGRFQESIAFLEQALALFGELGESDSIVAAQAETARGVALANLGRWAEAVVAYHRALAVRERLHLATHPDACRTLTNLGLTYGALGQPEVAVGFHLAAVAVGELNYGRRYCTGFALTNLGASLEGFGDLQGALAVTRSAHEVFIAHRGVEVPHPDLALTHYRLGELLRDLGRFDEAMPHLERSVAIYDQTLGPDHLHTGGSLAVLGETLLELGRCPEALAPLQRAVTIQGRWAPGSREAVMPLTHLGQCLVRVGRPAPGRDALERALAIGEANAMDPAALAETRYQLALALGRGRRAVRLAELAAEGFARTRGEQEKRVVTWLQRHR